MWKNRLKIIVVLVVLIIYKLIDKFVDNGPLKDICNILNSIAMVYALFGKYLKKEPVIRKFDSWLRRKTLMRHFVIEESLALPDSGSPFNRFKQDLLLFILQQLAARSEMVSGPDIFTFDFQIAGEFKKGKAPHNQERDWEDLVGQQFVFITGKSGSGKTYELNKRAKFACTQLQDALVNPDLLATKKIPVYIELKSLDTELTATWIAEYLHKTAGTANYNLPEESFIALFAKGEVIWFFDGLDEVNEKYRKSCADFFIKMSAQTGVHVSCRKVVFTKMDVSNQLPTEVFPAEYFLPALPEFWIKEVINASQGHAAEEKARMIDFLEQKPKMLEHLSRPIFLNLYMIVFHRLTEEQVLALGSGDEQLTMDVLWENYEDIIVRKKLSPDTDILGIRTITVWLAKIMKQRSFYIESIQPKWLSMINKDHEIVEDFWIQRCYFLFTRVLSSVIIGIALACIIATPFVFVSDSILGGLTISLLAGVYNLKNERLRVPRWLANFMLSAFMISVLITVCGAYQGLIVPRLHSDMVNGAFSPTETWPGILLGITLSTIFSYRIILEKEKNKYILPIELFHFDWGHAIRYGLSWGCASGVITGSIALYIRHQYPDANFIKAWLIPFLQRVVKGLGAELSAANLDKAIFCYAFVVTFFVASIIIMLLAGRYTDHAMSEDEKKKQKLNFGIISSQRQALRHAGKIFVLALGIYYLTMLRADMGNLYFCGKIAFGIALLAFLWFGGMEVINHRLLRVNLAIRGIAPSDYGPWVDAQQRMGFVIPTGYQMKFYHDSLTEYYMRYRIQDNPRIRLKRKTFGDAIFYLAAFALGAYLLAAPFIRRYVHRSFWRTPYEVSFTSPDRSITKEQNDSTYRVLQTGIYQVRASGYINVGTFVGYVQPAGTVCGFMGMPIDSAYNRAGFGKYRHAALLISRWQANGRWSIYKYLTSSDTLHFQKQERFKLITNDKEIDNNFGSYKVRMVRTIQKKQKG